MLVLYWPGLVIFCQVNSLWWPQSGAMLHLWWRPTPAPTRTQLHGGILLLYAVMYVWLFIECIVLCNRSKNSQKKSPRPLLQNVWPVSFLTWETLIDRVGHNVVGHHGLTVCGSALSSDLYAGDGWKLLQPRIVEGVGRMVWHLRCDLQRAVISYQKRQQTCNKTSKEQYATSKHMPAKYSRSIM